MNKNKTFKKYLLCQITYNKCIYEITVHTKDIIKSETEWAYYCDTYNRTNKTQNYISLRFRIKGDRIDGYNTTHGLTASVLTASGKRTWSPIKIIEAY